MDDLRQSGVFTELSVAWPISANLTGAQAPARIEFLGISPDYFRMLGVRPQLGRLLDGRDEAAGFAQTVVISDAVWRGSFGADPGVLGKILRLDNDPYEIVGVLPPDFHHPGRTVARDVEAAAKAGAEIGGTHGKSFDPLLEIAAGFAELKGGFGTHRVPYGAAPRFDVMAAGRGEGHEHR